MKKHLFLKSLLIAIGLLITSINIAWATKTAIPANTIIYVDITNFHDDSHTENNATDSKYYISKPNYWNVYNNRSTSATSTDGAGSYWPTGDSTWLELSVVSGNIYCAKTTDKWYDGNISFWTKNESTYGQVYEACVALMQEYDGTNNLYTISSGSNYHSDRHATCFGTDVSVMPTFKAGRTLYLNADTYWDVDKAIFRAYFFNGVDNTWATCTQVGSTHYYSVTVPDGSWTHVIFVRKNPANPDGSWTGKWNQTSDMAPSGMNNCVNITAGGDNNQSWGDYAPTPAIAGSMNNWAPDANVMSDGSVGIELDGGKAYAFQIVSGTTWYGSPDSQYKITCVGQDQTFNPTPSANHILLLTAGDGTYTFHWDGTDLTIDYPTVTHPSSDYVYFKDNEGWHESYFTTHLWGGTTGTTWETLPVLTAFNFDGTDYYYTALGGNTTGLVSKGSTSSDDEKTADLSLSGHKGQWYNVVDKTTQSSEVAANWKDFTATLTLKTNQGETTNPSPTSVTVTYGKNTHINEDVITTTSPAKTGYTFGGYYTAAGGSGTQVIDPSEKIPSNLSGYTTDGKWTKTGSSVSADLFAKWTQNITLNQNSATTDGTTSLAATYNAVLDASGITNPEKDYYDFSGWTNGSGGSGDVVINASKAVQTVASWTDGSKKWIHAGSSTLYAKWTEHPYTVTATASEGGSVGSASYTGKVVTTCAISATPNTGYKFSHWSVESGSATFADQYSASTTMNATSDAEIKANFVYRWSIAGSWLNYPETENWDADTYYMGNIGTNASSKDTCYVEISLAANTSYTFDVVDRSTSPYTFHKNGNDKIYYMTYGNSTNWGFGTTTGYNYDCGITTAGAGTYKFAYNISDGQVTVTYPNSYTVTFGYGTGGSAVTASVEDAGSINSGDYATAGKDITFTKTATNLAYTFKGWYNASSDGDAISCMASDDVYDDIAANISVYAQFKTRYGLHGSLMDDNAGGMPGWAGDGDDFVVRDYTDIGEGDGKGVELKCWRVLEPNREYKFRVQDRAAGSRWGLSESAVLPAEGVGSNVKLSTYGDENGKDVFLYTVGEGEYVFHITNMYDNRDGKYYPAIQVDRPASSQLTMGVYDSDHGSLSASSYKNNTFAITDGQFYANGSTLTFHATPNTGYHVEGWYSDASCETPYVSGTDGATICDPGDVSLVLSSVSTNKTVYVKFAEDENTLSTSGNWNTAGNWSAGHIPTINEVVYLPKAVTVDIAGAKAKRVRIQRDGESYTGKLTISATGGLVVAEDIKAQHEADGAYEATTKEDLRIETSYEGNGGLITGNACEGNNAEYEFYTKAYKYSYDIYKFYINQYIGIPFVSMEAYKLYGFNIFVYDDGADDWRTPGSATMEAWKAYDLIRRYENDDWSYFNLDGELNLPGKSATKTFTCSWRGTDGSIDKTAGHEDYLFANSWTAPISIKDITASNCSGTSGTDLVQTIYIFNAGYEGAGQKSVGEYAGQWSSFPLASSSYMANAVIPATQAFMVTSKKGSTGATLTLSYNDHVYKPAIDANQINTSPTRAPRRTQANDDPNVLRIIVRSSDVDADQLYVFERGDFTFDFDDSWDGNKILGESFAPQLYALSGSNKMAVNAVPDMEGMKIGFKAGKYDNQYTFSFEYADDAETLYLYDTDTQEYTQISSEATYSFTTSDTKEHERFVITRSKAPQIVTGVDGVVSASDARKQMINGTLYIIRDGRMYNAEGALVK